MTPVKATIASDFSAGFEVVQQQILDAAEQHGFKEQCLFAIKIAVEEALVNAIHHGNLEISSQLKESDEPLYYSLIEQRRVQKPYRTRRVQVIAKESPAEASYVVRDEGPGFDPQTLPDPTDPANLDRCYGRGLLLIRTFMDEVYHNETGNQITLIKRRDREVREAASDGHGASTGIGR